MVEVQIQGLDALSERLKSISVATSQKAGRRALGAAARVVRDAARQNARRIDDPSTAENIAKNITVRFSSRLFRRTGDLGFRVGVLGGAKQGENAGGILSKGPNPGGDTWYWRLVEMGTQHSAAQPFMRPAMQSSITRATDVFVRTYQAELDKLLAKGAK